MKLMGHLWYIFINIVANRDFHAAYADLLDQYEENRLAAKKKTAKPSRTNRKKEQLVQNGDDKENIAAKTAASKPARTNRKKEQNDDVNEDKACKKSATTKTDARQLGIKAFLATAAVAAVKSATEPSPEIAIARPANAVFRHKVFETTIMTTVTTTDYVGRREAAGDGVKTAADGAEWLLSRLRLDDDNDGNDDRQPAVVSRDRWAFHDETGDINESEIRYTKLKQFYDASKRSFKKDKTILEQQILDLLSL